MAKCPWHILTDAVRGFVKDDVMTASAALAFYSALALAPLILLFITISGFLGYESQEVLIKEFDRLTGEQGGKAISLIISSANKNEDSGTFATVISLVVLAFSASAVFGQLQVVLNQIFKVAPDPNDGILSWLKHRLFSVGMVFTIGFLMIVSLIASAALSALFQGEGVIWASLQLTTSVALFSAVFWTIFKYMPDASLPSKDVWTGAILTSALFSAGHTAISFYLGNSAVGSAYGAAGSLIVTLVWVYYSSIIIFFGAEITNALARQKEKVG